jgi:type VI secretion system protein ImpF
MAEPRNQEYLQPSLLDRLTDDEPANKSEAKEKRGLSQTKLRQSLLRDLNWLFNSSNLETVQNLESYPEVARSVLNFGMPDFTGHTLSGVDVPEIERLLRQSICDFEPRILRRTIRVRLNVDEQQMSHNAMTFDIEGELWAQPVPLHVYLKTELDLEAGDVKVYDYSGTV